MLKFAVEGSWKNTTYMGQEVMWYLKSDYQK